MSALTVPYTYRYFRGSQFDPLAHALRLTTCADNEDRHPYFFRGNIVRPKRAAELLRGLMRVVQARFHVPAAMLERILVAADPILTCGDDRLRFEGFSGCCGVYARVDLLPGAVRGEQLGRGTTNVDFNPPMMSALAMIRESDRVSLAVGAEAVELATGRENVLEKKVNLPLRWLKGLVEVQACQSRMQAVYDITGLEASRFLKSLPRMRTNRRETWIMSAGRGLRLSQLETRGAVRVGGLERLRVLEALVPQARSMQVFADAATGASGWTLSFDDSRFHLVISPEVWRGFSGEGQALDSLASDAWKSALPKIRAGLKWESVIELPSLASRIGFQEHVIKDALAALGARGLVGFDLGASAYFHRELPFDLSQVEKLQPRLQAARKLIAENKVRIDNRASDQIEVFVAGLGVEHRVRITADDARCTCPWYSKHAASRGPCKHILAARMAFEAEAGE
jgi:SWIM zinc finger